MGRHTDFAPHRALQPAARVELLRRPIRNRYSLPFLAFALAFAFVLVYIIAPEPGSAAFAVGASGPLATDRGQSIAVTGEYSAEVARDNYGISLPIIIRVARIVPPAGRPDPGTAQAIGYDMVLARGWGADQFSCLVALWNRESGWNVYASNAGSGAYGIPQAMPGSKMASVGADWQTNPATQITWGLNYIQGRYGTPCGWWSAFQRQGWY